MCVLLYVTWQIPTPIPQREQVFMGIDVFAGLDRNLCPGQALDISLLDAHITGEVSDGYWFTSGDGKFLPGHVTSGRFSTTYRYTPGPMDLMQGGYTLTLVSDDPDGIGPKVQVSDQVRISYPSPPVLVCNTNLNVSLEFNCTLTLDASILVVNPRIPYSDYIITLYDVDGSVIPNSTLTKKHVNKSINFSVGHICNGNICTSSFQVSDYYPPIFQCRNDTLLCTNQIDPLSLGLPIPNTAHIDTIINGKYFISNWDACGIVELTYTESVLKKDCTSPFNKIITRVWKAKDQSNNVSFCDQKIHLLKANIEDIVFPPNFDNVQLPAFQCNDTFPVFPNGHPSTDTTGMPNTIFCDNIESILTDVKFADCGSGFKIARNWFVIEWCSYESITRNQIILVKDTIAPIFTCQDSIVIASDYYYCASKTEILPIPLDIIDCSDYEITAQIKDHNNNSYNHFMTIFNGIPTINGLPVGNYTLTYIVKDACNNSSTCQSVLIIKDLAPPSAICNQFTKVAIDGFGKGRIFAPSLNNGSVDNCNISSLEIRRKEANCGFHTNFGPFIDFCCDDVGKQHHVSMQVTDIYGNKNTCHVEILVEDKLKPIITCPSNLTISCDYDYDENNLNKFGIVVNNPSDRKNIIIYDAFNNGVAGQDGIVIDNCTADVTASNTFNIQCYSGTISRKFVASDKSNTKDSCTQVITIRNPKPFVASDIIWPQHYTGNGCKPSDVDTLISGAPRFLNTHCANLASHFEDQSLYLADSACVKIFRKWTVIDWCQFDENTGFGKWGEHVQIIKISNNISPEIISGCKDTTVCNYSATCGTTLVSLSISATDDCTPIDALKYFYEIDLNDDGTIDFSGNRDSLTFPMQNGNHSVKWKVSDQCGNQSTCTQKVIVHDCKDPSPYCISELSMTLDEITHQAEIWASDFDIGSTDNCTPVSLLKFSFSEDVLDNVLFLDCSDITDGISEIIAKKMYVTDQKGNQSFCTVNILLTDNSNVCPDQITFGPITGKIATITDFVPENIQVKFAPEGTSEINVVNTNEEGIYSINNANSQHLYTISPELNTNAKEGLSTFDIVLIQRHILGLKPFDNAFQYLAADVNGSKSINTADLVELRRVVLGVRTIFPNDVPSWRFVDKSHTFGNIAQPWLAPASILSPTFSDNQDFIAIKMGDINNSIEFDLQNKPVESRSIPFPFYYKFNTIGNAKYLEVYTSEDIEIDGFQLFTTIKSNRNINDISVVKPTHFEDFHLDFALIHDEDENQKTLNILGYTDRTKSLLKNHALFSIKLSAENEESNIQWQLLSSRSNEVYIKGKAESLSLQKSFVANLSSPTNFNLQTNPTTQYLKVGYQNLSASNVNLSIFDNSGTLMFSKEYIQSNINQDQIELLLPDNMRSGIYFVKIQNGTTEQTLKLIKID